MNSCSGCPTRWHGQSIAHCAVCHLTFTTVANFDAHLHHDRCRTGDEMREKGYEPNDRGWWRKPMPEGRNPWETS